MKLTWPTAFSMLVIFAVFFTTTQSHAECLEGDCKNGIEIQATTQELKSELHADTEAVINYLRPLARTKVPESVLTNLADLIARALASEPAISHARRRSWIDTRSGKPVYRLDQAGDARWAGRVPKKEQLAIKRAIDRVAYQDPIALYAFNNPFSYNRESNELSKYYPNRFQNRSTGGTGSLSGEWVLNGADGLFKISSLNRGKSFSIEKHRDVLKKFQILGAGYSQDGGHTTAYYFFWFEKAPNNWKDILKDLPKNQGLENIGPPVKQAPDHINEAESMVVSYKAGWAQPVKNGKKIAGKKVSIPSKLVNPDGLFIVSKGGVTECRVKSKDKNGNFSVNGYLVADKEPTLRPGDLIFGGWWYPSYQQFYSQVYMSFPNRSDCNGWNKDLDTWSSELIPDIFETANGQSYSGYRPSKKVSTDRQPRTMKCLQIKVEGSNCRVQCIKWKDTKRLPDAYYLLNRKDALSLYQYLNIRGARVTSLSEAREAAAAAKELEAAKAREKAAREKVLQALIPLLSREQATVNFPDEMAISPQIHDFLLARFYPDQLNQKMLEAMMSSRWTYEKDQENPLGGRFFKKNGRTPTYKELQLLSHYFRPWILARAKALPETLFLNVPLVYGPSIMKIGSRCITFLKHDGSSAEMDPFEVQKADRKIQECKNRNKQVQGAFNRCQSLGDDLVEAEKKLARAQAGGCQKTDGNDPENGGGNGPCDIPANLTLANFQTEMMDCLAKTCGTPAAGMDMLTYQKCAQDVSEQFKTVISQMMGQSAPRQSRPEKTDACSAAKKRIQQIQQSLAVNRCDAHKNEPETVDCSSMGMVNRPDFMEIGRIDLRPMVTCGGVYAFAHGFNESAALLPKKRPFGKTQFTFMLFLDKLSLPYDLPPGLKKSGSDTVNARIKLSVKEPDSRSFRRRQFGLKTEVKSVDFL